MKRVITSKSNVSQEDNRVKEFRMSSNLILLYSKYNSLSDLEEDYKKFKSMTNGQQDDSNQESLDIFSADNESRYNEMKNKFYNQRKESEEEYRPMFTVDKKDAAFLTYESTLDSNFMQNLDKNRYRVFIQEDNTDYDISDEDVQNEIKSHVESSKYNGTTFYDTNIIYPMYTPEEIDILSKDVNGNPRYNYTEDTHLKDSVWRRSYEKLTKGDSKYYDFKKWIENIKSYYANHNKQGLIECGWNPYINPSDKNIIKASEATKSLYHKLADKIKIVDIDNYISNESADQSIKNPCNMSIIVIKESNTIIYETNTISISHMSPNTLVDVYVLKEDENLLKSIDFEKASHPSNDFNTKDRESFKLYLYDLFNECGRYPTLFHIYSGEAGSFSKIKSEAYSIIESIFEKDAIYHREIVSEAVTTNEFPIEFNKDGDLLISKGRKINFEGEYSRCHLALKMYEKNSNITGIKYCICKLWYMNILLEDILHDAKTTNAKKRECNKVRARIINDINHYSSIILKNDPDFDIIKTYENSPFNDDKIRISSSTIGKAISWIKQFLLFKIL